jgi:hypothetical protein
MVWNGSDWPPNVPQAGNPSVARNRSASQPSLLLRPDSSVLRYLRQGNNQSIQIYVFEDRSWVSVEKPGNGIDVL